MAGQKKETKKEEKKEEEKAEMGQEEKNPNAPLDSVRNGSISLAIFEGQFGKSAVLQKSYKKKDEDEWKRSQINLFLNEIDNLKKCVDEIYEKYKEDIEKSKKKK